MKNLAYYLLHSWVSFGLFCYYRNIANVGLKNLPEDKPVLLLSNHQNALMDILLIATQCPRRLWYITRADVFKNRFFRQFFHFLQMLPIYRIRDGRASLGQNQTTFATCAKVLGKGDGLLIFPEANHNLKRRVRPLSKGFTRIVAQALEAIPDLDLQLVPVGQNYQRPGFVGDSAVLYFGNPIAVQQLKGKANAAREIKNTVSEALKKLTTHIDDEATYDKTVDQLNTQKVNFLQPFKINMALRRNDYGTLPSFKGGPTLLKVIFYLANLPMVLLWRGLLKPKVPEPEFMDTFRFGFAMVAYPLGYMLIFLGVGYFWGISFALLAIVGHIAFNLLLVKVGI